MGSRYLETGPDRLPPLKLLDDLISIAARLGITNWDSIHHIDGSDFSALEPMYNTIIGAKMILPDKPNIIKSIT